MRPEILAFAGIAVLVSTVGVAADQPDAGPAAPRASQEAPSLEEVVVTGSRASLPGFSASTPTTVVSAAAIERESAPNIAQVLDEIPGFKNSQSPSANAAKTATPGSSVADLRGLGGQRTLVLVDGLRVPPTAPTTNTIVGNAVDMNSLPAFMIDRVEVVPSGASAK